MFKLIMFVIKKTHKKTTAIRCTNVSGRLASLGIMSNPLRAPLKTLEHRTTMVLVHSVLEPSQHYEGPQLALIMSRDASLSDSYTLTHRTHKEYDIYI